MPAPPPALAPPGPDLLPASSAPPPASAPPGPDQRPASSAPLSASTQPPGSGTRAAPSAPPSLPLGAPEVIVVGAGPAGLMAAEVLSEAGVAVEVLDAMPSAGRKFLLAGKGGLNLNQGVGAVSFATRYGARAAVLAPALRAFDNDATRAWAAGLGIETFVGSSGRVFPRDMKAAPLLRAWLHRLRQRGVLLRMRHRWCGFAADGALRFATPEGEVLRRPVAVVLALGGASWPRLGSDGAWVAWLAERGVDVAPLQPANGGFEVAPGWSAHFRERHAGAPLKSVSLRTEDGFERRGECVVTEHGLEGSLIYAAGAGLRDRIAREGRAVATFDLLPDLDAARVLREAAHPRGSRSLASHLKGRLGIAGVKAGLLHEVLGREAMQDPARVATALKALPVTLARPRPIAEAISTAGGVAFESLDEGLMLAALPGVHCAGEMLDWEAPTGGYLLQASFATGRLAARGVLARLGG